jgi:transcriptional regulator GlxA family with amidase domain
VEKGCQPQATTRVESVQTDVIQTIVRHIHESQGRGCHLENLARIAGYSKYHFLRLFQEHTGMSLRKCVDEARLQAFRRMASAGMPLKVMAGELGFAYPSALCRWRRRQGL